MIPRMLLVRGILFPVTLIDILAVIFLRLPVCLLHGTHDLVHVFLFNFSPGSEHFEICNQIPCLPCAASAVLLVGPENEVGVLIGSLIFHRPDAPLARPLTLTTLWLFPKGKSHKNGEWRSTKPDTDNLQKLLKDCMTKCGFWKDDAQVVREIVEKRWSDDPAGIYIEIEELEVAHEK